MHGAIRAHACYRNEQRQTICLRPKYILYIIHTMHMHTSSWSSTVATSPSNSFFMVDSWPCFAASITGLWATYINKEYNSISNACYSDSWRRTVVCALVIPWHWGVYGFWRHETRGKWLQNPRNLITHGYPVNWVHCYNVQYALKFLWGLMFVAVFTDQQPSANVLSSKKLDINRWVQCNGQQLHIYKCEMHTWFLYDLGNW